MCINNIARYIQELGENSNITAFDASEILAIAFCKSIEDVLADLIAYNQNKVEISNRTCIDCAHDYVNKAGKRGCWATEHNKINLGALNSWIIKNWDHKNQRCKLNAHECPSWRLKK